MSCMDWMFVISHVFIVCVKADVWVCVFVHNFSPIVNLKQLSLQTLSFLFSPFYTFILPLFIQTRNLQYRKTY